MLAARFYNPCDIRVEAVPIPSLPKNGALLKILACGLCGTDKRIYNHGHFHIEPGIPHILGHEIIGEIVEIDRPAGEFQPGDRVTLAPNVGCGVCRICRKGFTQLCENYDAFGISLDGGFAEYMAVPEIAFLQGNVFQVPEDFSRDEGAMIEISACAYRGLSACNPKPGETVLIIGGGVVTYLMCRWARTFNVQQVIVSVIDDAWGELSKRGQPDVIINSRTQDLNHSILDVTDGLGADVVIVACSAADMDALAPDLAAIQGRVNFFGGLPVENAIVGINSRSIHYREVTLTGTTGASPIWFQKTIQALVKYRIDLEAAITHHYPISEIVSAFEEADKTPRLKTMITYD